MPMKTGYDYLWYSKMNLPERFGKRCKVIAYPLRSGFKISNQRVEVQFRDGFKTFAIRSQIRIA